jgi:hypothetical protein
MATPKPPRNSCSTCGQAAGAFTCRGCSQSFCLKHTNAHRLILDQQMNDVVVHHKHVNENLSGPIVDEHRKKLVQLITQWEDKSIEKIHQTANETRQQLLLIFRENSDNVKEKLIQLTQQLTKAQYDRDFFEDDLKHWTETLDQLQHTLTEQQNIHIYQVNSVTPFISKISLTNQTNEQHRQPVYRINYDINQSSDAFHNQTDNRANLNMQGEYSSGDHRLRFILEEYEKKSWVLMGIISKSTFEHTNPYKNRTFYGWSGKNLVYLHGVAHSDYNGYRSDIKKDDIFQLTLDCDQQMIRLTNERTRRTDELNIDITQCPFPWKVHVRLLNNFQ